MKTVVLVNMPFTMLTQPSIGLGLMKSGLRRIGIDCEVWYPNIRFAETIGYDTYGQVLHHYNAFVGEWVFAGDLFGDALDPDRYVDEILRTRYRGLVDEVQLAEFLSVRAAVPNFLEELISLDWGGCSVVGFGSNYQQTVGSLALARRIKNRYPGIRVVLGGANCEGEMGDMLFRKFPFVDAVFSGEADEVFPRFVQRLLNKDPIGSLDGVFHRCDEDLFFPRRKVATMSNLNAVTIPDYQDYFETLRASQILDKVEQSPGLWGPSNPQTLAETSRGCWWGEKAHCTFCGLNGLNMLFRRKSAARVIEELARLYEEYGCFVLLVDNILDHGYVCEVMPELKVRCPDIQLFYEVKTSLDREELCLLAEAGVKHLQPGIESLDTNLLSASRKGTSVLTNVQFLKWCGELEIELVWPFLCGFPEESDDDCERIAALISKLHHLSPPSSVVKIQLQRFSPYFDHPKAFGMRNVKPHPSYRHIYPFPEQDLQALAYYFTFEFTDGRDHAARTRPLKRAVTAWQDAHTHTQLCFRTHQGSRVVVRRVCLTGEEERVLHGWLALAYELCDAARSVPTLCKEIESINGDRLRIDHLRGALNELVDEGLMISDGSRYLSLATREAESPPKSLVGFAPEELSLAVG